MSGSAGSGTVWTNIDASKWVRARVPISNIPKCQTGQRVSTSEGGRPDTEVAPQWGGCYSAGQRVTQ